MANKASANDTAAKLLDLSERAVTLFYNTFIRSRVPGGCGLSYNGVIINKERKPTDFLDISNGGWENHSHNPQYESAINRRLRERVTSGDSVVVVGGGLGTSTVVAARQTGRDGRVTTYEGSIDMVKNVSRSIQRNGVSEIAEVNHAVVSKPISLRGKKGDAGIVKPESLPECDVLELDCEGAEIDIIEKMQIRPREIIVESHGLYNTGTKKVKSSLNNLGYKIVSEEIAEDWLPAEKFCKENGIDVLTATNSDLD
jgi:hypothetical protein